jgi:hypothetical protein
MPHIGLEAVSPDGEQVVTRFDVEEATVINTRTGRYSRAFRPPRYGGTRTYAALDGMPPLPWSPFAPAVVVAHRGSVGIFNPDTLKTERVGRVVAPRGGLRTTCFLPSGRALMASVSDRRSAQQQLFVSDIRRTRLSPIDTTALGALTSVSCEAAGSADRVVVATSRGALYAVAASTIDGSPFTVSQ